LAQEIRGLTFSNQKGYVLALTREGKIPAAQPHEFVLVIYRAYLLLSRRKSEGEESLEGVVL
jgi:hypothetical protein